MDTSTHTVTWSLLATQGTTTGHQLVLSGSVQITNSGRQSAPLGNVVINLQTRAPHHAWHTVASDIADATHGDAAITANIARHASSEGRTGFAEGPASGAIALTNATTHAPMSLSPEILVQPGQTLDVAFSASFDNNVLALAPGDDVRLEGIVSYGDARPHGHSSPNVDIDGNGVIDGDEHWVGGTAARVVLKVPPAAPAGTSVVISDAAANLKTTGTVTIKSSTFTLGATNGTATVVYDGGASGGTIENCAQAAVTGTSTTLQACNTQTVPATAWSAGDEITYTQNSWTTLPASQTLQTSFNAVYTTGSVTIGGTFKLRFTSAGAVLAYIPATGTPAALTANLTDPTSSPSGSFGGDVLALRLNVDFADAGLTGGKATTKLGDLTLCALTDVPALDGTSVRGLLDKASALLGGGTSSYTIDQLDTIARAVNAAFDGGTPDQYAQDHLVAGACK